MKRPIICISILVIIVISLSIVQIFISNKLSTSGIELAIIQFKIGKYKVENAILAEKLLTASSYTYISNKAEIEGFIESKSPIYISREFPIAIGR